MPYIKDSDRREIARGRNPVNVGELTYLISRVCDTYLNFHEDNYQTRAEITAALENTKLEFYRRIIVPYEDKKIEENGDMWTDGITLRYP